MAVLFMLGVNALMADPCTSTVFIELTARDVFHSNPLHRLTAICATALGLVLASVILTAVLLQSRRGFTARVRRGCKAAGFCCGCSGESWRSHPSAAARPSSASAPCAAAEL